MSDRENEREDEQASSGKKVNDPLTRSDVEAPREPFGGDSGEGS